jgi:sugar lactone lactonase YvrE
MKNLTIMVSVVLMIIVFSNCNKANKFIVNDFIDTALFTTGIEGPAFDKSGNLYVVNYIRQGTIGKISENAKTEIFVDLPEGSIGNGIRFGKNGFMYIADYTGHNILEINMTDKRITVFAHDSAMNQPNDLCISPSGIIFASDPSWADSTGKLWRIEKNGNTVCLDTAMGTTNGIEINSEGTKLYVNVSIQRKIWVYDLSPEGNLNNKKLFYEFSDYGLDGMRFDKYGRLFVSRYGKGTIIIFKEDGTVLSEVKLKGKNPTNVAFGGKNYDYCYVTESERKCVEKFKIN